MSSGSWRAWAKELGCGKLPISALVILDQSRGRGVSLALVLSFGQLPWRQWLRAAPPVEAPPLRKAGRKAGGSPAHWQRPCSSSLLPPAPQVWWRAAGLAPARALAFSALGSAPSGSLLAALSAAACRQCHAALALPGSSQG